jgi:integrase
MDSARRSQAGGLSVPEQGTYITPPLDSAICASRRGWIREIGLDAAAYGTHTLRRTKASLIYRRTKNLRAVQLLLGHTKLESTVRYLGIEVDDALEMAEQTEV